MHYVERGRRLNGYGRLNEVLDCKDPSIRYCVVKSASYLGHRLGDMLFEAVQSGKMDVADFRRLFFEKHEDALDTRKQYYELIADLEEKGVSIAA